MEKLIFNERKQSVFRIVHHFWQDIWKLWWHDLKQNLAWIPSCCIHLFATCSYGENVPVGTFLQDAKYVTPYTFCDIFDVKCPLSGAKRVFGFFPLEQMNVHMARFTCITCHTLYITCITLVLYVSPQFWLEMSIEWRYNFNALWHFKI